MRRALTPVSRQRGFTLVELLIIIVVLGIAGATLTVVSTRSAELSAASLRDQQAMALANALLEEVKAMPFTYCDPNDANAGLAVNAAGCAGQPELMGPEPGEQRFSANAATRFDNINDYNGFTIAAGALVDVANNLIQPVLPTVANCGLSVAVANQAMVNVNAGDAVRITVTVRCPDLANTPPVVVEAVRVRYAPNRFEF